MSELDLATYFERIGYDGPQEPTLEVLRSVHRLHPQAIPFENLDPFLHRFVELDLGAIQRKLVASGRGGYCFEQNLLFMTVLQALGFVVSGLSARVLWNQPENAVTARSHMVIRVELDGRTWLADVGFGGLTMTAPLLLDTREEQETPHEPLRIDRIGGYFHMQVKTGGVWQSLYRFDLAEQFPIDYGVSNYFLCVNPVSLFRTALIAARPVLDRRLALMNTRFTTRHLDGRTERRDMTSPDELSDVLQTEFGITIPDRAAFIAAAREKLFGPKP